MKGSNSFQRLACSTRNFIFLFRDHWFENQVSIRAAALTYTFILSLVPALALSFAIFSVFADIGSLQAELKTFLLKNLATGTGEDAVKYIEQGLKHIKFKTIGYLGFGSLLVTGMLLLAAIQDSMNRIWQVKSNQKMWIRFVIFQAFFALGPIGLGLVMAVLAYVSKFFPKFFFPAHLASVFISATLFACMYKLLPETKVRWKTAIISALIMAVMVEFAKIGFAVYTTRALFYSKVYGALASLPFFLIWIYLNWTIFLAGTQLNYIFDKSEEFKL